MNNIISVIVWHLLSFTCVTKFFVPGLSFGNKGWEQSNPGQCMGLQEEVRKGSVYSYLGVSLLIILFLIYAFEKHIFLVP